MFEARYCPALQIIPMTLEAFAQTVVMCVFHERFSCKIIPRNLVLCTLAIGVLLIVM